MDKKELRKKYKALRNELSQEDIEEKSLAIANKALTLPVWNGQYYHLFLSIAEQREIDTTFLLSILQGKDKEVVLSKSNFKDGSLAHYLLTDNTVIRKNIYNIPEPVGGLEVPEEKIDVVFVPLLAFDRQGNRVGYGKGFYDRFLALCRKDVIKIGLSFFEAEEHIERLLESDIKLDYCITPAEVYSFS
ncbi:5-formyltetrahydrofolate cyclo-ligase [Sinomicrobium weinanense]|uniref:5-formyltetrahydrofolate cyclo-ligase n=1 Tax=Sinomicrobium weinanense TaxID=2842200 RepID=A0A926Q280_9FLAO|nr:5-formyltetrahydrofolate cyclo-ligase [Sinomicrobium weinanense]MBC9794410.1 5-formyltetrahydrofolate cyclo-ligase [Sinomicrobium weinanense]MBU3124317.1 5-formyltetrahydrofolate cyclo-ligase [Sinomicrobium weinanense]